MNIDTIPRTNLSSIASITSITPEHLSDVRALHRLAVVSSRWRYYAQREIDAKLRQIDSADYTQRLMARRGLAATLCDTLVGTAFWTGDETFPRDAALAELYVHPAFTRCGIATRLVQVCERLAASAGCIRLRARIDLNERALFAKLGYEPERFERNEIEPETCFPLLVVSRPL
jgi:GNAT superfamily N-acetyltransferase